MSGGEDAFATAVAGLIATAEAGFFRPSPTPPPPPPTPVPVAPTVVVGVPDTQPVPATPTTAPAGGEGPGAGALLLLALGLALVARWLWRTGRLPVWDLERAALWLPWRREEAAAWWRCRWQGRDWLVRGVLPAAFWQRPRWWPLLGAQRRAYLAVLAGEEGSGKSYLLTYLAVCLVLGVDWLGFPVRRLRGVVYADSELDAQTFWQRVEAIVAGLEPDDPQEALRVCRRRLAYLCLLDYGEDLAVPSPDAAGRGRRPAGLERIRRTVRRTGAGLVLLDGLTTGGGVAPGDQEGATRSQNALQRLGCAVLAIDHTNDAGRLAGSRSKSRLARIIYTLRAGSGGGARLLTWTKGNFSPAAGQVAYRCAFHPGATDGELGPVTFTTVGGGEGAGERRGEGAGEGMRPRPLVPLGVPLSPAPHPQGVPTGDAGDGDAGDGDARGDQSRVTQGSRRRPPERTAYPLILAALEGQGPDAEADYDALAAALPQYTRHTIATRCGELVRLGRLAPGEREGTVRLPS